MITETKLIFLTFCTNFSKTTAPRQVIFFEKLSTIIIFKRCKFNVNLWTLCFLSYKKYIDPLKTLDTIGNCQRQVFSLDVSQHTHKITNLWKFELNWSSKLRDINQRKNTKLCAFRCLISKPQVLNLRSRNQIRRELLLSRKLYHFRGSRSSPWPVFTIKQDFHVLSRWFLWKHFIFIHWQWFLILEKG